MELFGQKLKTLRQEKGITQEQLASKVEIVKSSISGYEKGSIYPSVEVLIKLCKFFDVSADYLLGLSDNMEFKISHLTDEQLSIILSLINQFERFNYSSNQHDI